MELDLNHEHFFQNLAHFVKEVRESQLYVHLFHDDVLPAFQQVMNIYDINAVFFIEYQVGIGIQAENLSEDIYQNYNMSMKNGFMNQVTCR